MRLCEHVILEQASQPRVTVDQELAFLVTTNCFAEARGECAPIDVRPLDRGS